jgi:hypothetical protein
MTQEEEKTPDLSDTDLLDTGEAASPLSLDAAHVIEQFGGIRPMAAKTGVAVTTVQGWKSRGTIPANRHEAIAAAAAEQGIELTETMGASDTVEDVEPGTAETGVEATTGSAPETRRARSGSGLSWVALAASLVAVLVAVAVATQSHWDRWGLGAFVPAPTANGGAVSNAAIVNNKAAAREAAIRIETLTTRLAGLEAKLAARGASPPDPALRQRIAALEARGGDSGALHAALATAQDRVASVEKALDAILAENAAVKQNLTAAVEAMNSRAGALSTDLDAIRKMQDTESEGRKVTVGLALSGLEAVLVTDRPFQLALTALRDVATNQSAMDADLTAVLARIEPFAATGAPTLAQLTRQYRNLAPELARRVSLGKREGWVGQTLDKIYDVVSWRRVGGSVDQIADSLAGRDLKSAAALLSTHPELEPVARDWIADARNRIAATTALDAVRATITNSVTGSAQ